MISFHRNTEAAQAAAQAAARINQQLGVSSPPGNMQQPNNQMGGLGMVITEEFKVPDRMVGLSKSTALAAFIYCALMLLSIWECTTVTWVWKFKTSWMMNWFSNPKWIVLRCEFNNSHWYSANMVSGIISDSAQFGFYWTIDCWPNHIRKYMRVGRN